jgi:hypothetical protein
MVVILKIQFLLILNIQVVDKKILCERYNAGLNGWYQKVNNEK